MPPRILATVRIYFYSWREGARRESCSCGFGRAGLAELWPSQRKAATAEVWPEKEGRRWCPEPYCHSHWASPARSQNTGQPIGYSSLGDCLWAEGRPGGAERAHSISDCLPKSRLTDCVSWFCFHFPEVHTQWEEWWYTVELLVWVNGSYTLLAKMISFSLSCFSRSFLCLCVLESRAEAFVWHQNTANTWMLEFSCRNTLK